MGGNAMIVKTFDIKRYDWSVHVYIGMDTYYIEQILNDLNQIDCSKSLMEEIEHKMRQNKLNTGFTYSRNNGSVIVTAPTSEPKQMLNSLTHEIRHLVDDIARQHGLNPYGEEVAYLTGEITMELYDEIKMIVSKQ